LSVYFSQIKKIPPEIHFSHELFFEIREIHRAIAAAHSAQFEIKIPRLGIFHPVP